MAAVIVSKHSVHRRIPVSKIRRLVRLIHRAESRKPMGEISVQLFNNAGIRRLNRAFLGHNYATDVIAFDLGDGSAVEGEICVGADMAFRQAREFGVTFSNEILRLVAHGFLHILGHDDATPRQRNAMLRLGEQYLNLL